MEEIKDGEKLKGYRLTIENLDTGEVEIDSNVEAVLVAFSDKTAISAEVYGVCKPMIMYMTAEQAIKVADKIKDETIIALSKEKSI